MGLGTSKMGVKKCGNWFICPDGTEFKFDRTGNVTRTRFLEATRETRTAGRKCTYLSSRSKVVGNFTSLFGAKNAAREMAEREAAR